MTVNELKVRKGEPVRTAWNRLVKWVETLKIVPDEDIEIRVSKHGTIVRVRDSNFFRHPFRVIASGETVRVATGTINDVVPLMKEDKGERRRIDNRDKDGAREEKKSAPAMRLDFSKAGAEGRIYIALKYKTPPRDKKETAIPPEIVQTDTAKGPVDGFGYYPLGVIRLSRDRKAIDETFQVVHHNLRCTFQEKNPTQEELKADPEAKPIGRYVFYPV